MAKELRFIDPAFRCDVLKEPIGRAVSAEEVFISEVRGSGSLLVLSDGSLYEVNPLYTIYTGLWLGMTSALILNGQELINLDSGDELILVRRVR